MRKKALLIFAFLLLAATPLKAFDILTEVKGGYFYPTDKIFREIYSPNGIYGMEITTYAWDNYYIWIGADFFTNTGHSIGLEDPTSIYLVPLTFGLKYFYPVNRDVDLYAGLGFQGTYLKTIDDSPFVAHEVSNWDAGGIVKFGAILNMDKNFFIDLFTNYSYQKMDFQDTEGGFLEHFKVDLSGFTVGVGIGYRFCN